jgi:hypothetical protein
MRRRDFIVGMGVAIWPMTAQAQATMPVVGYLHPGTPEAQHAQVRL